METYNRRDSSADRHLLDRRFRREKRLVEIRIEEDI
jgi:hypothetical protein